MGRSARRAAYGRGRRRYGRRRWLERCAPGCPLREGLPREAPSGPLCGRVRSANVSPCWNLEPSDRLIRDRQRFGSFGSRSSELVTGVPPLPPYPLLCCCAPSSRGSDPFRPFEPSARSAVTPLWSLSLRPPAPCTPSVASLPIPVGRAPDFALSPGCPEVILSPRQVVTCTARAESMKEQRICHSPTSSGPGASDILEHTVPDLAHARTRGTARLPSRGRPAASWGS